MNDAEIDRYFAEKWRAKPKRVILERKDMGLDMYLYKRDKDKNAIDVEERNYGTNEVYEVEQEFIYWRKANQIHMWLVDNVQGGVDDCEEHQVSTKQIVHFYDELVKARLSRDESIFSPSEGFFFGSTDIDEYYWQELRDTIEELKPEIEKIKELDEDNRDNYEYTFFYRASW